MSKAEFHAEIARLGATEDRDEQERIRAAIWEEWGREGAVFITDMANFSITVRTRGIVYFLAMIQRCRRVLDPIVEENGGRIIKHETDNAFAWFDDPADAIRAGLSVMKALRELNVGRPEDEQVNLGIGVDWGRVLLIDESDYFGDPVNTASKLGEDLADNRELFVTDRALARSGLELEGLRHRTRMISDIEIDYVEVPVD